MKVKIYKIVYLLINLILYINVVIAQSFSSTIGPLDLNTGINYTSCTSPGTKSVTISVNGLSNLTSTFALGHIKFSLGETDGSSGSLKVVAYLKSPNGTCAKVFDGDTPGLSTAYTGTLSLTMASTNSCANTLNSSNIPVSGISTTLNQTGQYGVFSCGIDLATNYLNENPNGNWTIYFFESSSDPVDFISATLVFGNPTVYDQTASGDNCVNAINWDGSPTCATSSGKIGSSNMPGWQGPAASTFGSFSGGSTCGWNGSNDNDTWIKFTALLTSVCINISGLDQTLQSVIVTDSNTDGDNNPCTGSGGGQYWQLVSCPDNTGTINDIYSTTAGTQKSQNHCFTATIGQQYYLVVDGNNGQVSPFFINGLIGTQFVLPIELLSFNYDCMLDRLNFNWKTNSEINNDYFTLLASIDAEKWEIVEIINGSGNSNSIRDYNLTLSDFYKKFNYFKLKQTDFDGKESFSKIIVTDCSKNINVFFYPNPANDEIIITLPSENEIHYQLIDQLGSIVLKGKNEANNNNISIEQLDAGVYVLFVNDTCYGKLIKQ